MTVKAHVTAQGLLGAQGSGSTAVYPLGDSFSNLLGQGHPRSLLGHAVALGIVTRCDSGVRNLWTSPLGPPLAHPRQGHTSNGSSGLDEQSDFSLQNDNKQTLINEI